MNGPGKSGRIAWLPFFLMVIPPVLVGCAASPMSVNGTDHHATSANLRLAWTLGGPPAPSPAAKPEPIEGPSGVLLELDLSRVEGRSHESIPAGDQIDFAGTVFAGPGEVETEFRLTTTMFQIRGVGSFPPAFRFSGTFGLGILQGEGTVRSSTLEDRDATTTFGPVFGGRLSWTPVTAGSIYFESSGFTGMGGGNGVRASFLEAGVEIAPVPEVTVAVGWRRSHYNEDRNESDLNFMLSGLLLSLRLAY